MPLREIAELVVVPFIPEIDANSGDVRRKYPLFVEELVQTPSLSPPPKAIRARQRSTDYRVCLVPTPRPPRM